MVDVAGRKAIVAGAFALAVAAAPVICVTASIPETAASVAQCPIGEQPDEFVGTCVPYLVPNSPLTTAAASSVLPSVDGIPCTGSNTGQCIGLGQGSQPPQPAPQSTVSSSP